MFLNVLYLQLVRVKMFKVRVYTCFFQRMNTESMKDMRNFSPKSYYDFKVPVLLTVAQLRMTLLKIWNLSCHHYNSEFYRDWFDVSKTDKLNADVIIDDGTTVFAVVYLK